MKHRLRTALEGLSRRQLLFVAAGAAVLAAVLVWGVLPLYEYRAELERRQAQTQELLREVSRLESRYRQAGQSQEAAQAGGSAAVSLFSFVETQADRDGVKEHMASMRPNTVETASGLTERQVQIRLEAIRLQPLVRFLEHIEYAEERIFVKRLTIRSPREEPGLLRVDLLLSAFEEPS